uniref:Uncharacterized protein n=1 Tax=Setaria digitata TaxID=48799 RepID=A0A915Q6C9_9BILA
MTGKLEWISEHTPSYFPNPAAFVSFPRSDSAVFLPSECDLKSEMKTKTKARPKATAVSVFVKGIGITLSIICLSPNVFNFLEVGIHSRDFRKFTEKTTQNGKSQMHKCMKNCNVTEALMREKKTIHWQHIIFSAVELLGVLFVSIIRIIMLIEVKLMTYTLDAISNNTVESHIKDNAKEEVVTSETRSEDEGDKKGESRPLGCSVTVMKDYGNCHASGFSEGDCTATKKGHRVRMSSGAKRSKFVKGKKSHKHLTVGIFVLECVSIRCELGRLTRYICKLSIMQKMSSKKQEKSAVLTAGISRIALGCTVKQKLTTTGTNIEW